MKTSQNIFKQRKELKYRLESGIDKTFVDVLLQWGGRGKILSPFTGTMVFFILPVIFGLLIAGILGEFGIWQLVFQNLISNPILFVWVIFSLLTSTVSMIIANLYFHQLVCTIQDHVLASVESHNTLDDIENWIKFLCNKRIGLLVAVVGGLIASPIIISINSEAAGVFVGIGHSVLLFLFAAQSSLFIGFIYGIMVFTFRLGRYKLQLFESDPANSEVIARLSDVLIWFVYFVAIYGGVQTFGIVALKLPNFSIVLFLFWTPIVVIFLMGQISLSRVIQNSKWKTLNAIQSKITVIQRKPVLNKEDQENLLWLLAYHDRVKLTRSSAFDLKAGISFLNSMLLPLVGFLLGNIDTFLDFFR